MQVVLNLIKAKASATQKVAHVDFLTAVYTAGMPYSTTSLLEIWRWIETPEAAPTIARQLSKLHGGEPAGDFTEVAKLFLQQQKESGGYFTEEMFERMRHTFTALTAGSDPRSKYIAETLSDLDEEAHRELALILADAKTKVDADASGYETTSEQNYLLYAQAGEEVNKYVAEFLGVLKSL